MSETKTALLVATDAYEDPKFRRLRAPTSDAEALAGVLADPAVGGFAVRSLVNEAFWTINEEIEGFFSDCRRDDLLLLYFACHGLKDPSGRLYFATSNTKFARLAATGVSSAWVNEQMDRCRSRRIVMLLDCCYSGAFARGLAPRGGEGRVEVVQRFDGRGRAVITASDAMEYAYEGDELAVEAGAPSVFTGALVGGLTSGEADRDGDGKVGLEELYDYVYDRVREVTPDQTPTMSTHGVQGELFIAANPHPPPPPVDIVPLPFELRQAAESELEWQRQGAVGGLRRLLDSHRPGLALSARQTLQRLAQDDSAAVRTSAEAALHPAADSGPPSGVDGVQAPEDAADTVDADRLPARDEVQAPASEERLILAGAAAALLAPFANDMLKENYEASRFVMVISVFLFAFGIGVALWHRRATANHRLTTAGLLVGLGLVQILRALTALFFPEILQRPGLWLNLVAAVLLALAGGRCVMRLWGKGVLGWSTLAGRHWVYRLTDRLAVATALAAVGASFAGARFTLFGDSLKGNRAVLLALVGVAITVALARSWPDRFRRVALSTWVLVLLAERVVRLAEVLQAADGGQVSNPLTAGTALLLLQLLSFGALGIVTLLVDAGQPRIDRTQGIQ